MAVRSHCRWPGDITPASVQVTPSRLRAQNRVYTAAQAEYGFPGKTRSCWFKRGCALYTESTLGAQDGATAGSADKSQQESREHLETPCKQPDGHLVRTSRVERRQAPEAPAPGEQEAIPWGAERANGEQALPPSDFSQFLATSSHSPQDPNGLPWCWTFPPRCLVVPHPQPRMSHLCLDPLAGPASNARWL